MVKPKCRQHPIYSTKHTLPTSPILGGDNMATGGTLVPTPLLWRMERHRVGKKSDSKWPDLSARALRGIPGRLKAAEEQSGPREHEVPDAPPAVVEVRRIHGPCWLTKPSPSFRDDITPHGIEKRAKIGMSRWPNPWQWRT